jgi:hypothetical protein
MRITTTIALATLCTGAILNGCKQEIVQPLVKPEDVAAAKDKKQGVKKPEKKADVKPTRRPQRAVLPDSDSTRAITRVVPQQAPNGEALPAPDAPIVITPGMMVADSGSSDTEGGWNLNKNGMIYIQSVSVRSPLREIVLDLKGEVADDVWPMMEFTVYNRDMRTYYEPLPKSFVTWPKYMEKRIPLNPYLPTGEYQFGIRFLNNEAPGTKGDRNLHFRKLVLIPVSVNPAP